MTATWLYLASVGDMLKIATPFANVDHGIPPAGMHLRKSREGPPEELRITDVGRITSWYVEGEPDDDDPDRLYWATLGELLVEWSWDVGNLPDDTIEEIVKVAARMGGGLLNVPVVMRPGEGRFMRWLRVTHRGILGGGVEQFQFKVDLGNPGADPDLDEGERDALSANLANVWSTAWLAHSTHWSALIQFTEIGVAQVTQTDPTDKYGNGGNQEASMTSWTLFPVGAGALQGGGAGPDLPYEVALAVTLQTDHRGPSGRGRLYLPAPHTGAMTTAGIFSAGTVTEASALIGNYIEAIADATPHMAVVVSPRRIILNEVTSINVGQVPDSQRRRRRSQDEARVVTAIT